MKLIHFSVFVCLFVTLQSLDVKGSEAAPEKLLDKVMNGYDPTLGDKVNGEMKAEAPKPVKVSFPGFGPGSFSGSGGGEPDEKDCSCTQEYKKLMGKWRESFYEYQHAFYLWKTGQPYSPKEPDYYGSGGEGSGYSYKEKPKYDGYP